MTAKKGLSSPYSTHRRNTQVSFVILTSKLEQLRHAFDMRTKAKKAEVKMALFRVRSRRNCTGFGAQIHVKYLVQCVVVDIHVRLSIFCMFNPALVSFLIIVLLENCWVVLVNDVYFHKCWKSCGQRWKLRTWPMAAIWRLANGLKFPRNSFKSCHHAAQNRDVHCDCSWVENEFTVPCLVTCMINHELTIHLQTQNM